MGFLYIHTITKDIVAESDMSTPTHSNTISLGHLIIVHFRVFLTYIITPPPLTLSLSLLNTLYPGIFTTASGEEWVNHVSESPRKSILELHSKCSNCSCFGFILRLFKCPPNNPFTFDNGSQTTLAWFNVRNILLVLCRLKTGFLCFIRRVWWLTGWFSELGALQVPQTYFKDFPLKEITKCILMLSINRTRCLCIIMQHNCFF